MRRSDEVRRSWFGRPLGPRFDEVPQILLRRIRNDLPAGSPFPGIAELDAVYGIGEWEAMRITLHLAQLGWLRRDGDAWVTSEPARVGGRYVFVWDPAVAAARREGRLVG